MNIISVIDFAIFLFLCTFCDKNEPKNDRKIKFYLALYVGVGNEISGSNVGVG